MGADALLESVIDGARRSMICFMSRQPRCACDLYLADPSASLPPRDRYTYELTGTTISGKAAADRTGLRGDVRVAARTGPWLREEGYEGAGIDLWRVARRRTTRWWAAR